MRNSRLLVLMALCFTAQSVRAEPTLSTSHIRAHVRPTSRHFPPNQPVIAQFLLENTSDQPVTLTVPDTTPEIPSPEAGLPLSHLFSGVGGTSGVTVMTESGRPWDKPVGFRRPDKAPILMIAPHGVVGATLDLREYFPLLRGAGSYTIRWSPYGGAVTGEDVTIRIEPRKQVEITVDEGKMVIELFYDDAPQNVANFLELAASGFYTAKTFHRSVPGYMIQGGCPRGDGTGIRLDGKRVPSEINQHRHDKGAVSMALLDDDPDSGSCQFFITNTRVKEWDEKYTVFGQLIGDESYATLERLMEIPVDDRGRPTQTIYMRSVRVLTSPESASASTP